MIVVIADDLSGATELAGVAWARGLTAEVQTRIEPGTSAEVVALDTETRCTSAQEAAERVGAAARKVLAARPAWIYKKTDSVLRGHVRAEVTVLLAAAGKKRALLISANPGRHRIIEQGRYYVNGIPLDQTVFATDPEHPTGSSQVAELLCREPGADVHLLGSSDTLPGTGIAVPDVVCAADLARRAFSRDEQTLCAGAAEFFGALLALERRPLKRITQQPEPSRRSTSLYVCGSAAAWPVIRESCAHRGIPVFELSLNMLKPGGSSPATSADLLGLAASVRRALADEGSALMAIGSLSIPPSCPPSLLTETLARAAADVLANSSVERVFLEGGATAAAVLRQMNCHRLVVECQFGPGLPGLRVLNNAGPLIVIKPGSYAWPENVWEQSAARPAQLGCQNKVTRQKTVPLHTMKKTNSNLTRRQFLQHSSAAALATLALPILVPSSALAQGATAPNARIALGAIGVGEQGNADLGGALALPDVRVIAVADVKKSAREATRQRVNARYQNQDCVAYADFRELLARKDIDGVLIATPDHWHVFVAIAACQAGKDLYLEKPMGLSLDEDQALRRAVNAHQRVFQFGTQQRSSGNFRRACELVRSGLIGQLRHMDVWCIGSAAGGPTKQVPIPPDIDYDFWVGPAVYKPYTELRTHADMQRKTWWFEYEYALGFIAGWGVHPLDIAYWGAGPLAQSNIDVKGSGEIPTEGACNTAIDWNVEYRYATGVTMTYRASRLVGLNGGPSTVPDEFKKKYGLRGRVGDHGTAFVGDQGWVHVNRGGLATEPEVLLDSKPDSRYVGLYRSNNHMRNFVDCMRSRQKTICPVEDAVQADLLCHLADQAVRRGRKLTWDFKAEKFVGDDEANRKLGTRPIRQPWKLG